MKAKFLLPLLLPISLLVVFFSATQAQFNEKDLIGAWQFDVEKMIKQDDRERKTKTSLRQELKDIQFFNVRFVFLADGSYKRVPYTFSPSRQTFNGTWKLKDGKLYTTITTRAAVEGMHSVNKEEVKLVKLTPQSLVFLVPKSPGIKAFMVPIKPIIEKFKQRNEVNLTPQKVTGLWKVVATSQENDVTLLGFTRNFKKDGFAEYKTILGNNFIGEGLTETWKILDKNTLQFIKNASNQSRASKRKVVYLSKNEMIIKDKETFSLLKRIH